MPKGKPKNWSIETEMLSKTRFSKKTHKTTQYFDPNTIAVYTQWKRYALYNHNITELELRVLSQLNNQTERQNAHCIGYNIHLPIQKVNRILDELWNKNLINILTQTTKPTQRHPNGQIRRYATINKQGKNIFNSLASFHKKYYQL